MTDTHQKEEGRTPDLVERLRDPDLWRHDELEYIDPLAKEAAAEIERLRAKLAEAEMKTATIPIAREAYENSVSRMKDAEARAEFAEAQLSHLEMANLHNDERARAAEKRLAEAEKIIGQSSAALNKVNKLVSEAAGTGFNCQDGDWTDRIYESQQGTSSAIRAAAEWMQKGGEQRADTQGTARVRRDWHYDRDGYCDNPARGY